MPIHLRGSTYYLRRRVPKRYASVEDRTIVYLSLKTDSLTEARRKEEEVWNNLVAQWEALLRGDTDLARERYAAARDLAQARGYEFLPAKKVAELPLAEIVDRVEAAMRPDGKIDDRKGRAFLGAVKEPGTTITECLEIFWELTKDEAATRSPNQRRVWANNFKRAIKSFVEVIGDIEIERLSADHMMELREWYSGRIERDEIKAETANKQIMFFGTVLRRVNKMRMMGLDLPLSGWGFKAQGDAVRQPFSTEWIKRVLVEGDNLRGLNDQARGIVLLMVNTGLRPSEAAGLQAEDIHLDHSVPHIEVRPQTEGEERRALKTRNARRVIPLAGISLEAMRAFPGGFPCYYDKPGLSQTVNKYLRENGLMETPQHTLYCLRHSFEDRMLEAGIDERLRRDFLGHALERERYGSGGDLRFRQAQIQRVAL
ncbi:tyrosine-type recombinase/integrase [Roseovarius salis]|uniref:tyrosine-type recombinase/integrase n=1 Tax=Roseovarius salis TaxID=3376063 RepID=UPI0037C99711